MRNLIILFVLLFSISLISTEINAQNGYTIEEVHLGTIKVGDTFSIPVYPNQIYLGYAASFQQVNANVYRFVGDWFSGTGSEQVIGEIATMDSRSKKQIVYRIFATIKQ